MTSENFKEHRGNPQQREKVLLRVNDAKGGGNRNIKGRD